MVVTSRFRELDRVGNHHGYFLRLESGRHVYRDVTLEAGPACGAAGMSSPTGAEIGSAVRCSITINYRLNTVRMIVPRSCIASPCGTWHRGHVDPARPRRPEPA